MVKIAQSGEKQAMKSPTDAASEVARPARWDQEHWGDA
jgi:hypothetical protein